LGQPRFALYNFGLKPVVLVVLAVFFERFAANVASQSNGYAQLFCQLAHRSLLGCFARVNLASRDFPLHPFGSVAVQQQNLSYLVFDNTSGQFHPYSYFTYPTMRKSSCSPYIRSSRASHSSGVTHL